ncbi:hypothetical protein R6Q59_034241 [Mikania micrantha]
MMPPVKQENSPEMNSRDTKWMPEIKSETVEYSPSKRLKTLSFDSPSTSSKGKSKIANEDDDDSLPNQQLETCGVCLSEEGMFLRGFIDSCEHYFCFVCIMEWAKVESRCPICKRRFSTIRRPPKDGVFISERIVDVPVRDQIYYYNGNATIGPSDPYSQVKCSGCCGSSDEHLLLLCDLCDSAAHSYCVGLGTTVPEGDWFCKDCTLSRDEHHKIEANSASDNGKSSPSRSNRKQFIRSDVSIFDIVRESSVCEPVTSFVPASVKQSETSGERLNTQATVARSNAPNARTLQRCINVHSRIRVLRENWDGFRGGSLNFSSRFEDRSKTGQSQLVPLNNESTSQNHQYDTDRAWKMMNLAAKASGKKPGNKNIVPKDSEFHKKKERLLIEASKVRPTSNYFGGLKKKENELLSSRKIILSAQVKNDLYNFQNISTAAMVVGSDVESSSVAADKCCGKKVIDATLEKKENIKKDTQFDGNIREIENVKSEIQSLVKLNLKLLSKDKKLEVDVFKEVARHATHSIMAACGIEPPKARFRSFERLVCDHSQTRKRPSSTLMPTSCRECFFIFVKDVVSTIASDKTTSSKGN